MQISNIMTRLTKSFLLIIFFIASLFEQNVFDDYLKKQDQDFNSYKKTEQEKFQKYKDKQDSAFVEFLKQDWLAMQVFQGLEPDRTPKPPAVPETRLTDTVSDLLKEPARAVPEIPLQPPLEKSAESIDDFLARFKKEGESLSFAFFDVLLTLNYDQQIKQAHIKTSVNEQQVSEYWASVSRCDFTTLLNQAQACRERLRLND